MKISVKKSITVLLSGIMLLTAVACGSSNEKSTAVESKDQAAADQVKLRILWWGSQSRHDATLKALDLYTQKNPNVTFEPEFSGWEGYWDKLATQSAAKNAPDIIQMDASYLAEYAGRKQLADLSTGISTEDIDGALLNTGKYQDKLYAIPLGNNAIGMTFNKEAVEKLGITKPKSGWTWDEFFAFGKEAKAKVGSDHYALPDLSASFQQYVNYQLSKGLGQVFTDDGKLHLDKDTYLEYQLKFAELRKEGIVPPGEVSVTDKEMDPQLDLMVNGTTLLRVIHAAQSNSMDSLKPGVFDFVTIPRNEQAGGWLKPSMFWSASANSKHVEEAKKFIDWFINDPEAAELLGTSRGVPVSKKIVEKLTPKFNAPDKMGIALITNTAPDAQLYVPEPKGWSNFTQKDFKAVGEKIMFGEITPEQAYEELAELAKDYQ
ncbi:ABC transporter substrate-binding protein [Paenibacillus sp. PL91]|uniref:ABC transporter substrate-binding protein n=1 Tax=Paenibacillus sp. PL91 TaxID=2729538 RepID=UPI00145DC184|nr:extracellular solute-binding protein [Paenibacillus sp. PL91]MBC9203893.1 extracellular solute-binding protein [Paenibacillus sp. PL91]